MRLESGFKVSKIYDSLGDTEPSVLLHAKGIPLPIYLSFRNIFLTTVNEKDNDFKISLT